MPTNEELIPTKAELLAARDAADGAVWPVFYAGLALMGFAHARELGDPRESEWQCDKFGTEAEQTFRRMIERRDELQELLTDRVMTALEEAKARAGDQMPVSVGDLEFTTYHRAALEVLRRFVMLLWVGNRLPGPAWVRELTRKSCRLAKDDAELRAYYASLLERVISFDLGNNVEEMETGIRCECARAVAVAPDAGTGPARLPETPDDRQLVKAAAILDDPIAGAIVMLARFPGKTVTQIAHDLGVRRQRLYEDRTFQNALKTLRAGEAASNIPKGSKDKTGHLEATSPPVDWSDRVDQDDVTRLDQIAE